MTEKAFILISFASTHLAIKAERILKKSIDVEMIPTPRSITASCGLSIKAERGELETAAKILNKADIDRKLISIYDMGCDMSCLPEEIFWER